jgi:glutathione S-transferase
VRVFASPTSPFARKVRIALLEKGIAHDVIMTDAAKPDPRVAELNPLAKIPVLERGEGRTALFDSPVILEWLDDVAPPILVPKSGEARVQVLMWQALADGIMDACVARLIETRRPEEKQVPVLIQRQERKVESALTVANAKIGDAEGLVGREWTLADIALVVACEYVDLRHPHDWRSVNRELAAWHAAVKDRPSFVETRPPPV